MVRQNRYMLDIWYSGRIGGYGQVYWAHTPCSGSSPLTNALTSCNHASHPPYYSQVKILTRLYLSDNSSSCLKLRKGGVGGVPQPCSNPVHYKYRYNNPTNQMVTRPTVHSTASQYTYTYSTYPSYPTNHPSCSRVHVQYSARARGCPGRKPPPGPLPLPYPCPGGRS